MATNLAPVLPGQQRPYIVKIRVVGNQTLPKFLSPSSLPDILQSRTQQANVKSFSPHDLRRTFGCDLLDAGADIASGYDRGGERTRVEAISRLHMHWQSQFV